MSKEEIDNIINRQKLFFQTGKTKSIEFRLDKLKRLEGLIENNSDKIIAALKEDFNKNAYETYTSEIFYSLKEVRTLIKNLKSWSKPKKVSTPLVNRPGKSYYNLEPFGIVLIISPWNYPFGLLFTPLAGAIAAGNCVIAKPSEVTNKTSNLINQLISENFENDFIKVIEGDAGVTQSLIRDEIDFIFFTGSTSVGRKIMQKAGEHLIPVTLELGGKNPCIVDRDIDIKVTAKRIAWGKYFNAGQTCIAPNYIAVEKSIKKKFVDELQRVIEKFYINNSYKDDFTYIINEKHFNRLVDLLCEGKIVAGGDYDKASLYMSPTLVDEIDFDSKIMQDEIFGPILPIIEYEDLQGLLEKLKGFGKPLVTYFFSKDKSKQKLVADNADCGSVCINGTIHLFVSNELPFGGVGSSGMGRYHGKASLETFSYKKSVLIKKFIWDLNMIYPPYKIPLSYLKKSLKYFY